MNPRVVAVLLTTNALDDTVACLRSLQQSTYDNLGIVVADNASSDGSEQTIRGQFPEVQFLQLGRNAGFAAGNNAGIRLALRQNASYVLLLNNDTLVDPNFLQPLVDSLENDPGAGCSTGTICFYPETDRLWYAGGDLIRWRASGFSRTESKRGQITDHSSIDTVTFVSGCLVLFRRTTLERLGLLDERTFLYCEDTEYSLRMLAAGYRMLYVPNARIFHKTEHRNRTPFALYYVVRNRLLIASTTLRGWEQIAAKGYVFGTTILKMMIWRLRRPDLYRAAQMALEDYVHGVFYEGRGLSFPYRSPESPRGRRL